MTFTKKSFITGFALFSMFFGAGNLILPPFLGMNAGSSWWLVVIGFLISAVVLPMLGIVAHGKLQGTMYDFGKKVSPQFSMAFCIVIYIIAVALPSPRTAAVTHEMAIQPFFNSHSLVTSSVYFLLVFIFSMNRSNIISLIGKYLTPIIVLILVAIIGISFAASHPGMEMSTYDTPFISGMLEGYQTYDAIGGIVVGAVLIISLRLNGDTDYDANRRLINRSAIITGSGLAIIYTGLIVSGALSSGQFDADISRTALLSGMSILTLGSVGNTLLSILISLACFTTAVGIVIGAADFFKGIFKESKQAYVIALTISCILGVVIGQFDVHYIIVVAIPTLMFIYPLTIILVLLNVVPDKYASQLVFRAVVGITLLFSIPDFLSSIGYGASMQAMKDVIPLGNFSLAWLLPAIFTFVLVNVVNKKEVD